MDIYAKTVKLNDKDFKEIIGVKRTTFEAMVTILKKAYAARPNKHRGGRKKKLSIEEQLILILSIILDTFFSNKFQAASFTDS